jgi:hypothetical protein
MGEEVSETKEVCALLHGLTDPRLLNAKLQVIETPALKATFDSALNFIAQFIYEKNCMIVLRHRQGIYHQQIGNLRVI